MNRFLLLSSLLLFVNLAAAQEDSTSTKTRLWQFGARSGFYYTAYSSGMDYYGYLTAGKGCHEFSIGTALGRRPYMSYIDYNSERYLNGIDLSYRILPNNKGRIFDFYFQLNYFQKWSSGFAHVTLHHYPNQGDLSYDRLRVRVNSSQILLEQGFDIKFLKYFYLGTSIGIGGRMENQKYIYRTFEERNSDITEFELDFIYRVSFGLRI